MQASLTAKWAIPYRKAHFTDLQNRNEYNKTINAKTKQS